ncbi:MAG: peptidase M19 [Planctomycetes bacterium]|nr:peptidase M19 [Planctomycetota bacterium]
MLRPTRWCDGHLDLAYLALHGHDLLADAPDPALRCVSLPALVRGRVTTVLGTIFTERSPEGAGTPTGYDALDPDSAFAAGVRQLEWYEAMERAGHLRIVRTATDLDTSAPLRVVLLMEGADPIRSPEDVAWWHARGVRVVGLTWALGSRHAGGNAAHGGLTALGRETVAALDGLGMLHDASHLADAALDDLLATSPRAVVASHSNCRALVDDRQRHLRDDQIAAIAARGGVVGLNLYGSFLAHGREATLHDALAHLERVASIAGRHQCCLGSDLDGGFTPMQVPAGVRAPDQFDALDAVLAAAGWTDGERENFAWGAWDRTLRTTCLA